MKLDRLIGIIATLQQKKQVTAPYLAEKFEVSRRTILRDLEDISRGGIPIVTTQGMGGGISIMEGFSLDTTVFTREELSAIFTGLKTLDTLLPASQAGRLASKLGSESAVALSDYMMIDLSSFYRDSLAEKMEQIKQAIETRRCITFHYYYSKGEADKRIEPYMILFKWSNWYVFGYCKERQDFRMYKLRQLWELRVTDEIFSLREIPEERKQFGSFMTDDYLITAIYDPSVKYRLVEEYGPNCFTVMEDGRLYTKWGFTDPNRAISWFLGFGDQVVVTDPPEFVEKMRVQLQKMNALY